MASLSLKHIYKVYEGTTKAVNDFNMEIRDREFIVFVGPSGCGKSTTLRMIAGLEDISAGELRIDGVVVNDMEPRDRNIAMVFQNYALYPHMSVYENMAFALKTAHVPKKEIHEKVTEAARILGITEYLERKPRALSGGQRQRVALGRAIVRHPKVFLFDEPLSNLDAKLRAAMRAEIIRLYERLGTTFIYVTHDQVEAMTMGTRIVVMKSGVVQQIDTPLGLYNHPENMFVAGFIGTPRMNFWEGLLRREGDRVGVELSAGVSFEIPYEKLHRVQTRYLDGQHPLVVGIRPDDIRLWQDGLNPREWVKMPATVSVVEMLGGESLIYARIGAEADDEQLADTEGASREVILKIPADDPTDSGITRGDKLEVALRIEKLHVFDKETERTLNRRIVRENVCPATMEGETLVFAGQRLPLPPALIGRGRTDDPSSGAKKAPLPGELCLPTDAILLGTGAGRAHIAEVECFPLTETQGDGNPSDGFLILYRLDIGGEVFFASEISDDAKQTRFSTGDTLPFDVDFSRITMEEAGIRPLPLMNELEGHFSKEKVVDERSDSPTRGRRIHRFSAELADIPIEADPALCEKLFSCMGSRIFHTPLTYRFPPDSVTVLPRGEGKNLFGRVTALSDYGRTTYAHIAVGNREIVAPYHGAVGDRVVGDRVVGDRVVGDRAVGDRVAVGDAVSLLLDQARLTVLDRETGIILA